MRILKSKEYEEVIMSLSYFGLEKLDSIIYLTLLESGISTMSELASKLDVDRGRIYRTMEKLVKLGLVKIRSSKVTTAEAIKPEKALLRLVEKKQLYVENLHKIKNKTIERLKTITLPAQSLQSPSFWIIEGRNSIYAHLGKLIQDATHPVYLITTTEDLIRMYNTAIPEKINIALNKKIPVRILVDTPNPYINKFGSKEVRIGRLPSKSRLIVEKGTRLLMSDAIKDSDQLNDETESILYTDSPEMTENMYVLCQQIWNKAKQVVVSDV